MVFFCFPEGGPGKQANPDAREDCGGVDCKAAGVVRANVHLGRQGSGEGTREGSHREAGGEHPGSCSSICHCLCIRVIDVVLGRPRGEFWSSEGPVVGHGVGVGGRGEVPDA